MDRIDRYRIDSMVEGRPGSGIYVAFDELLNRTVTLRLYRDEDKTQRNQILARLTEISINLGLSHPNLSTAVDWGEYNEFVYVVTDDSGDRKLSDVVANPPGVELATTLSYMMQSARALHYSHSKGITHGQLSPSKISLLQDGQIKIMDVGIGGQFAKGSLSPTKLGPLAQALAYQAPEQFEDVAGPLSDVFAFGVIFFHLLTGEHPFQKSGNKNLGALVQNIMRGTPPAMKSSNESFPPPLEELLLRTLQKAPKNRYQSFEEIQTDLTPILSQCESSWSEAKVKESELLFDQGETKEAQDSLMCVLRRAPALASAISLRNRIQLGTQQPELRTRCEQLLRTGKHSFQQRDYLQAIKNFEEVLALDVLAFEASRLKDEAISIQSRLERVQLLLEEGLRQAQAKHFEKATHLADLSLSETIALSPLAAIPYPTALKLQELIEAIRTFERN